MKERDELDKMTDEYLEEGVDWEAVYKAIIGVKKSNAVGNLEQFASDSFQMGWFACVRYFGKDLKI